MHNTLVILGYYTLMKIGYARVSTFEQNLDLQLDALKKVECEKIFEEKISSVKIERPKLKETIEYARQGDIIIVWKLDRLGRSLKELIEIMNDLEKKKIGFKSLHESIDTTTSTGKLIFHMFGALAEFERNLIKERTLAGMESARTRGRMGGRPEKLNNKQIEQLKKLYETKTAIKDILETFKISRRSLYNYLNK